MSDISPDAIEWSARFAADLGVDAPSAEEFEALLALAGVAARASTRQAAPIACWLAARAGLSPADALVRARSMP